MSRVQPTHSTCRSWSGFTVVAMARAVSQNDFTELLQANSNSFIVVSVQYRLGPFGFLASEEVARRGVANAGLLNQFFALQWVQAYINRFGGNVSMVTISGESARGGLVMLKGMAYGSSLRVALFHSAIAASPYLPRQYAYDVLSPTQTYQAFADHARCRIDSASQSLFDCLVSKDTATLQNASATVTAIKPYGAWASCRSQMVCLIQEEPSSPLLKGGGGGQWAQLAGRQQRKYASFLCSVRETGVEQSVPTYSVRTSV